MLHPRSEKCWRAASELLLFVKLDSLLQFFETRSIPVYIEKGIISTLQFCSFCFSCNNIRNPTFPYAAYVNVGNVPCTAQNESSFEPVCADMRGILAVALCIDYKGVRSSYSLTLLMKHVFAIAEACTSTPHHITTQSAMARYLIRSTPFCFPH